MQHAEFDYLKQVAGKYGGFYAVSEFEGFVDTVTPEQVRELSAAYEAIAARGDAAALSRWIDDCFEFRAKVSKLELDFSYQVRQLLLLFLYLGDRGIRPFASRAVRYVVRCPD